MDANWYETFFRGIVIDLWRQAVPPELTENEVDFLERELELEKGDHVLDVPCGFGRHALALAERGYRMTGIDVSSEMIDEARERAGVAGLDVEWCESEMRSIDLDGEVDAAFCFGNSFGYLDPDGMRAFLVGVARALRPHGRFAFDYGMSAEGILPRFNEREWGPVGDTLFLEHNEYLLEESCIRTSYRIIRDGDTQTRTGYHWVYTTRELRQLLLEAGLAPLGFYRSHEKEPFELGAPELIAVAKRA